MGKRRKTKKPPRKRISAYTRKDGVVVRSYLRSRPIPKKSKATRPNPRPRPNPQPRSRATPTTGTGTGAGTSFGKEVREQFKGTKTRKVGEETHKRDYIRVRKADGSIGRVADPTFHRYYTIDASDTKELEKVIKRNKGRLFAIKVTAKEKEKDSKGKAKPVERQTRYGKSASALLSAFDKMIISRSGQDVKTVKSIQLIIWGKQDGGDPSKHRGMSFDSSSEDSESD